MSGVKAIAAGGQHSMALKQDGTVVAWGDNSNTLQVPAGLSGVKAIAAGGDNSKNNVAVNIGGHSLALKENDTVVAWGSNSNEQTTVPTNLSGVKAIAAGGFHNLALKEDGTVVAWGKDFHEQTIVPAGLSGVKAIAAGMQHSLALEDNTAPAVVGSFDAEAGDGEVSLSWDNPSTPDFQDVRILRSTSGAATSPEPNADQTQVYEGSDELFTDTGLTNGTTYYYTIYARDDAGNFSPRTVVSNVTPSGAPPTANDQSVEVAEDDKGEQITLSGSGASGSAPLSYKLTSLPTHGTLYKGEGTDEANKISTASAQTPYELGSGVNRLTYVPDADYNGTDSFTYKANDGTNDSNVATVSITVNPETTAPTVTSVTPTRTTGVSRTPNITATFSEPVDKATAEALDQTTQKSVNVKLFHSGKQVAATVSCDDDPCQKVTITPENALKANTKYRAIVSTRVEDLAGNRLDQDPTTTGNQPKRWTFITRR